MPDRDDMPELGPDPMDDAYLGAEQMLDDEAARAARRARVLAAVAQEPAATPAPAPSARRPMRRYGGWLAAACVAGLGVWTAGQVYRLSPRRQQGAPLAVQPPAPPAAKALAPAAGPPPAASRTSSAPRPVAVHARPRPILPGAPIAPPPDIAPPPPLPLPPVERPSQALPPPLPIPLVEKPIQAPLPLPPPAPVIAAKPGATEPAPGSNVQSVVVSGSRIARRDYATQAPVISGALVKALDGPSRLREAAAAGRTADIEALLAQGVPVDAADENGETALMRSIEAGRRDAVALFRRHGASLDLKNRAGVSARDMAAMKHDDALDEALGLGRQP
jgi:hypothetical protein